MHYRFYFLSEDDHIHSAGDYEFADDSEAFAAALGTMRKQPIEVWQSTRVVFRIYPSMARPEAA